jgi:probable rRNA maturation factor
VPEARPAVIEVEVFGAESLARGPSAEEVRGLCQLAASALGARDGHLAVEFIDAERMAELNARYRGKPEPTDVLSFPIDGALDGVVPRERVRSEAALDGVVSRELVRSEAALDGVVPRERVRSEAALDGVVSRELVRSEAARDGAVPRELGDVLICPAHTTDAREAVVHGVLHLLGMDHEVDNGEMLELQAELLARRKP